MLAVVKLVRPHLSEYGIVPQGFDAGTVQPPFHATFAFERFPAFQRGDPVVFLEYLVVGVFGHLASLQGDELAAFLFPDFQCIAVTVLSTDQDLVVVRLVFLDQLFQATDTAGKRMVEFRTQFFTPFQDLFPKFNTEALRVYSAIVSSGSVTGSPFLS